MDQQQLSEFMTGKARRAFARKGKRGLDGVRVGRSKMIGGRSSFSRGQKRGKLISSAIKNIYMLEGADVSNFHNTAKRLLQKL